MTESRSWKPFSVRHEKWPALAVPITMDVPSGSSTENSARSESLSMRSSLISCKSADTEASHIIRRHSARIAETFFWNSATSSVIRVLTTEYCVLTAHPPELLPARHTPPDSHRAHQVLSSPRGFLYRPHHPTRLCIRHPALHIATIRCSHIDLALCISAAPGAQSGTDSPNQTQGPHRRSLIARY